MNPVERGIRWVDGQQRRFTPTAFVFGVIKKYGDDNGGVLVSNLAFSTFMSLVPLLLVFTTILGLAAASDPGFREAAIDAVQKQFPLVGGQLTSSVGQLRRSSVIGLVVGLLASVWGTTGLAQAGLFTMEQVWNLPGPARPGFVPRLGRAVLFLGLLGLGVIATSLAPVLTSYGSSGPVVILLAEAGALVVNAGMYMGAFRVLTPKGVPSQNLVPGAVTGGVVWTGLQYIGIILVHHFERSGTVYGVFGIVLGLMGWLYLGASVTVYVAEINVVLSRRLWPRAIVQPPLTEADRASMALQALQNQRRPEQDVLVTFNDRPDGAAAPGTTPRTPDEVAPPARQRRRDRRRATAQQQPAAAGQPTGQGQSAGQGQPGSVSPPTGARTSPE